MLSWLFIILGLFLPSSWAKHWLTSSSLVNGVLVDYLMPDLWLQDILAMIIIIANFQMFKSQFSNLKKKYLWPLILIIFSVFFSTVPLVSMINFSRFLLALGLSWILIKNKNLQLKFLIGLAIGSVWSGLLAIGQFALQGTVFGWRFLGEPIFSVGVGGIKKLTLFGAEFLAPMATFPHANVMGAFGLLTFYIFNSKELKIFKIARFFSLVLAVLSFSIPIYLILAYLLITPLTAKKKRLFVWAVLTIIVLAGFYYLGLVEPSSIYRRWDLVKVSFLVIKNYPILGVGWGAFVKSLPEYSNQINFLQPVHNVYLLILSELGLIGASGLLLMIGNYIKGLEIEKHTLMLYSFIALWLFTFDHYFWTTTQGVYLLWVIIALF